MKSIGVKRPQWQEGPTARPALLTAELRGGWVEWLTACKMNRWSPQLMALVGSPWPGDFGYGFQMDRVFLTDSASVVPWWEEKRTGQDSGPPREEMACTKP